MSNPRTARSPTDAAAATNSVTDEDAYVGTPTHRDSLQQRRTSAYTKGSKVKISSTTTGSATYWIALADGDSLGLSEYSRQKLLGRSADPPEFFTAGSQGADLVLNKSNHALLKQNDAKRREFYSMLRYYNG
jgi:hypothetical protein